MSLPVATTITGIDSLEVLQQNLRIAQNFKPMTTAEMDELKNRCKTYAADGRYELYKVLPRNRQSRGPPGTRIPA